LDPLKSREERFHHSFLILRFFGAFVTQILAEYSQYAEGPINWTTFALFITEYASLEVELSNTVTIQHGGTHERRQGEKSGQLEMKSGDDA